MARMTSPGLCFTILALAVATPAAAQVTPFELDNLRLQQVEAQRQAVAAANQATVLESQLRTQQAIRDLENQRVSPVVGALPAPAASDPTTAARPSAAAPASSDYPSMPDRALAESNRQIEKIRKHRR